MEHASIQAGCIATSLTSCPLPLDARHVDHNPHVALVQVVADVRLLLGQHHRPLEKVFAPANFYVLFDILVLYEMMLHQQSFSFYYFIRS